MTLHAQLQWAVMSERNGGIVQQNTTRLYATVLAYVDASATAYVLASFVKTSGVTKCALYQEKKQVCPDDARTGNMIQPSSNSEWLARPVVKAVYIQQIDRRHSASKHAPMLVYIKTYSYCRLLGFFFAE